MIRSAHGATVPPATEGRGIEIVDGGMRMIATRATDRAASGRRWRRQLAAPPTADEAFAALNELIGQVVEESEVHAKTPVGLGVALWGEVDSARQVTHNMPH
ncbi:MAG: hypothetical protein ACRDHW_07640, partial [Ktedonobacteraceae bacterium]